jgi:predicted RNA-binding Zn-ribbon protein involved in translation (DUF1610 family)
MKKFTCGHCGGRIAITPRNLGKLVVCPDCGKHTHPLAGEILAAAKVGEPAARSPSAEPVERKCENCGRTIGRLETLQLWQNHLVCNVCHPRLAPPPPPPPARKREKARARTSAVTLPESAALPTPAANAVVVMPRADLVPAAADARTIVRERGGPIPVMAYRAAKAAWPLPKLEIRQRLYVLLAAAFVAGAALYGALTLLRDLMGILTLIALVLMAAAVTLGLTRLGWTYLARWIAGRRARRAAARGTGIEVVVVDRGGAS